MTSFAASSTDKFLSLLAKRISLSSIRSLGLDQSNDTLFCDKIFSTFAFGLVISESSSLYDLATSSLSAKYYMPISLCALASVDMIHREPIELVR